MKKQRPHPLQNKVDPWGELQAVRMVGALMGNRGILHDEEDRIVRRWANKSWVCCSLNETFQKRSPFSPGTYSELFFLDEATAYAAGHRPCHTCRRQAHDAFNKAWTAANSERVGTPNAGHLPITTVDAHLHTERLGAGKRKLAHMTKLGDLPVGAMFAVKDAAVLVGPSGLRRWSFSGYQNFPGIAMDTQVALLTPPSIVASIRYGLTVQIHPSGVADSISGD
jgi:hypothetical protein